MKKTPQVLAQKATLLFIIFILFLSACGKSNPDRWQNDALISGDLGPAVEALKSGTLGPCDEKYLPQMSEIAKAVDRHMVEIDAYTKSTTTNSASRYLKPIQLGPMVVREVDPTIQPRKGWQFDEDYSWGQIIEEYKSVNANPTAKAWYELNMSVRGILTDDQSRILYGDLQAVGYDDEAMVNTLLTATKDCLNTAQCLLPPYGTAGDAWLSKQSYTSNVLNHLQGATTVSEATPLLNDLKSALEEDARRFQMRKNSAVNRDGNVLHLPLYTSDFATVTTQLAHYIESVWTSPDLSLTLDWKNSATTDVFSILLASGSGGRSYVSYREQQVVLYDNIRSKAIAHEIGHVLGFPDHYYDVWDESSCTYRDQYREDDLMSADIFGRVLPEEWATLQKVYPGK